MTAAEVLVQPASAALASEYDVAKIRADFPILQREIYGKPLVYLDNAATSQKPRQVIDKLVHYHSAENSNVHRGVHFLSQVASQSYEESRVKIQRHINARSNEEIVFVRGATEAINLVAATFGRKNVGEGDEILISAMEHHSNIVPWQILCQEKGARLRVIPMNDRGELLLDHFADLLNERTRLVGIVHMSNALGTVNPVREIIETAHQAGVPVLVDGAQSIAHSKIDVQEMDCDFFAFSGHKIYGPNGIGVLYGKAELLRRMPPYQGGGDMINSVTFEKTTYSDLPYRFEAGTPNIAGAIGLGAAFDYVNEIGIERIAEHERDLLKYATRALSHVPGLRIIGTAAKKASVISFILDSAHPHDIGTIVDHEGIAIRTGHHCAQPVMDRLGIPATARASVAMYNTREEIDALVRALYKVIELFS
jgi:cysteine desulfurase/selenocysteine lyase